jgi:hypothetical protein
MVNTWAMMGMMRWMWRSWTTRRGKTSRNKKKAGLEEEEEEEEEVEEGAG